MTMPTYDAAHIAEHMRLKSDTCDTAGCTNASRKTLVVEFYHNGAPCLTQCRDCNPSGWSMAAEAQKEMWLRG